MKPTARKPATPRTPRSGAARHPVQVRATFIRLRRPAPSPA